VTIPGVGRTVAEMLVGEIGVDMTRLPTAAHLRSWVRVCPRSDVCAGKHRSTRVQKGGAWIKPMLVGAAWAGEEQEQELQRLDTHRAASYRAANR
jgi:transposase